MANITRTTQPLDTEVQLPNTFAVPALSAQAAIYAQWLQAYTSGNPIIALTSFFYSLTAAIDSQQLDTEFYAYWYTKSITTHPEVAYLISSIPEYQKVNENIGTLFYALSDTATIPITSLSATTLKPYPQNIESLLPDGMASFIQSAYSTVNTMYASNIINIQTNPTAVDTQAHGVSLVKDTVANIRNTQSQPLIQSTLQSTIGVALNLTEIENTITGNISIMPETFNCSVEGSTATVDVLTNISTSNIPLFTIASLIAH